MRTRVKICGITRPEDARCAVDSGADAIGLVFYPDSPRYVSIDQARQITGSMTPFVTVVSLFVDADAAVIREVVNAVQPGLLQFHGQETNDECRHYGVPFIKSIGMKPDVDVVARINAYPDAAGFLLDTWQPLTHGGGGEVFDWQQIPHGLSRPVILAGGLSADNVAAAISETRPYAVDVSSGVESAKGIKSPEKIAAFMKGVLNSGTETTG